MCATLSEAVHVLPLKGDQILAQGFNAVLGKSGRRALKGHQNLAHNIGSKSFAQVSSFLRHFQGAFLGDGYPGLKLWAEIWFPFRGEI